MRLLFVYRVCGLGGVETSIINKFEALGRQGIEASALFGQLYGEGGKDLARRDARISVGLRPDEVKKLLAAHDAIAVIDYPEFLDALDEWEVPTRVVFESHVPPPLQRSYHALTHPAISAIVVPSLYNKEAIERIKAPRKEIVVVPHAIDPAVFHRRSCDTVRGLFGDLTDSPAVVWIGRLEEAKNPEEFLRVGAKVLAKRPEVRFVIVGDTDDYEAYRKRLSDSLSPALRDRFTFLRWIPYGEISALYSLAAWTGGCLLSTSRYESLPMVLIEAMACGCPVVASNIGGVGELVIDRGTGRLYEAGDVSSAASAVLELLNPGLDSTRHKLVERAYETVTDRHSLNEAGRRYAAILSRPPRARPRPLVSAIMIFLNAEAFIEEAIESVLAQTFDSWELLLIDDGSTDASTDIARRYCARYPGKVRHLEHPGHVHRGKSAARNLGVQHARGSYLAFLDAADVWLPNKLDEQVEILETYPEAAMAYGRTLRWHSWTLLPADEPRDNLTELGVPQNQLIQPPELVRASLNEDSILAIRSALIRRNVIEPACCFADELEALDELAIYVPIFLRAPVFASSRCWAWYRQRPDMRGAGALRTKRWDRGNPNPLRERYLRWLDRTFKQMGVGNLEMRWMLAVRLLPYRHPLVSHFVARVKHVARRVVHGLSVFVLDRRRRVTNAVRGDIKATPNPARLTELGFGVTTLSWQSTAAEVELRVGAPGGPLHCHRGPSGSVAVLQWPGERRLWYLQDASNSGTTTLRRTLGMAATSAPKVQANSATSSGEYSVITVDEDRPRTLLVASGQPLFAGDGAIRGHLEHVAAESGVLRLVGWAASATENGGPCTVVVFIGDRFRCTAVTGVERPDLADRPFGALLRSAGFECVTPGGAGDVSRVRAFAISNGGEAIELPRGVRRSTRRQYRLSRDPTGSESLSMDDGSEVPIAAGAAEGFLDAAILDHGRAVFTGWAAEPTHSGPADDVVIFVDDRFTGAKPPHIERPDVVQAYGTEVLRFTGFLFNLPCRIPPDEEIRSVRAFAISHSRIASELRSLGRFQDRRATAGTGRLASARDPDRSTEQRRSTPRPRDRVQRKAMPPLVTSILTTYNHAAFIEQAVRSVQDQDLAGRHQIVVIDDCSTDGTTDILRRIWADDKERIQLIVAPQNECNNRRFAAALEASEGPFVAALDGDDYWTDSLKLQRQIDFLQANDRCVIAHHNALLVYDDGSPSRPYAYSARKQIATLADILEGNFICGCTAVLRTRACRSLPPWYATAPYGDWPLWILAARHGDIGYTDEIMATYRVHRRGLWSGASRARQLEWDLMLYECLALGVGFGRDIIARRRRQRAYDLAVEHEKCGDIAQAAKYLRLCVANRPPDALEAHLHGTDSRPGCIE